MQILVLNSGSSSLKFKLYDVTRDAFRARRGGAITHFGPQAQWRIDGDDGETRGEAALRDHGEATQWLLAHLPSSAIDAVGHRVVHGGARFRAATLLTPAALEELETLTALAPLHNPPALQAIYACREALRAATPMIAVFDTAFHAALPETAAMYAIPRTWTQVHGIRRYGFHGIAHRYMHERFLALSGRTHGARVVTLQLGNGCSACAIHDGRSIETSMGYTPLEGLVMATRSGDVDPGALLRLLALGVTPAALEDGLNRSSGLLGLSGESANMQTLLALESAGHVGARDAIAVFCHRARKYLGAYLATLGGADAVLFGGGIGEHAAVIRARICADMGWCGLRLDATANAAAVGNERRISAADAAIAAYVIPVDEELLIARDTHALLAATP